LKLTRTRRIGDRDHRRCVLVDIDRKVVARSAPHLVDILVVHDRKQPARRSLPGSR
jgi:hypothetical protein